MKANKYNIGDYVQYTLNGETKEGRIHGIKIPVRRNSARAGRSAFTVILEDSEIGYNIIGTTERVVERYIIKKL